MRLYFVLFLLPLLGNGNLWFAPNKQTMATNTIHTQLEEKKAALDTLLSQHGLTIKDLSADEQQILAKMENQLEKVTSTEENEDPTAIRKKLFLQVVEKGIIIVSDSLRALAGKKELTIDLLLFEKRARACNPESPIGEYFVSTVTQLVSESPSATVEAIQDGFKETIIKYSQKTELVNHYNEYYLPSYSNEKIIDKTITQDFHAIAEFLADCAYIPIIDDPIFVETTPEYQKNEADRNSVEQILADLSSSIQNKTNEKYDKLEFNKTTTLNGATLINNLEAAFITTDQDVNDLYATILNRLSYQVEIPCYKALDVITSVIDKYRGINAYSQLFVDKKELMPVFVEGIKIANALCNAKAGAGGDVNQFASFRQFFNLWKKDNINHLVPVIGDTSNTTDAEYLHNFVKNILSDNTHSAFDDFWKGSVLSAFDLYSNDKVFETKSKITNYINSMSAKDYFEKLKDTTTAIFPDIRSLAAAINDSAIDTSFATYIKNWRKWSDDNLVAASNLGIKDEDNFHTQELKINLHQLFSQPILRGSNKSAGFFVLDDIAKAIDLAKYMDDNKNGIISGKDVKEIWNMIIANALPTSVDFGIFSHNIGGRELSNHIANYTKDLPTKAEILAAVQDSRKRLSVSRGIPITTKLVSSYVLQDNILNKGGHTRGFSITTKAYLKKKGKLYYVASIVIKDLNQFGIRLGKGGIKFTTIGKPNITDNKCTQTIELSVDVADFGSYSLATNLGAKVGDPKAQVQLAHQRGNSAPIGSGTYKTNLTFIHTIEGSAQVVDFNIQDAKVDNLPTLTFDTAKSTMLTPITNE